jgi:O-antigen/teichoic acid export membrane protein
LDLRPRYELQPVSELTEAVLRGGLARVGAQALSFGVRIGSIVVFARLLSPGDFGFVGMVTAITGMLSMLRDFGLSSATVQRVHVTEEQLSSLFWFNLVFGALLGLGIVALAPLVSRFYHEPRLFWVTVALAPALLFNAAGVQHSAILQRRMRFATLSAIDVGALVAGTGVGVAMAAAGFRYWSLVAATVLQSLVSTACLWSAVRWVPGRPRMGEAIRSMLGFGGTISLLRIITYVTSNLDKVLVGRFWGANSLGIYGRAYQLINVPTLLLNSAVAEVGFALLARVQHDRGQVRSYFLKSYSLVLAMTIPITVCAWEFAPDLVSVLLGSQWREAAPILRLLAPTILAFALIDPITWLMYSQGMLERSFRVSMVFAPAVIAGYVLGLPFGPKGVALGYSIAIVLSVVPRIAWGVHGTGISLRDVGRAAGAPLAAGAVAVAAGLALRAAPESSLSPLLRLVVNSAALLALYAVVLLYVLGQKAFYFGLLRTILKKQHAAPAQDPA